MGDSTEIHVRKGKRSDEGRYKESKHTDRSEERQRRTEDRYRGERARESYERHERELTRENSSSRRRDERHRSPGHHRYERTVVYKSRDHSRDKERSVSSRTTDRKQSKRDIPPKERPSSDSETDGEMKPPLSKRPSVISPLSTSDDSEKDSNSSHTTKELNSSSRSPERIDDKTDNSLKEQVKSWKDIANESSESDNDSSQHDIQDDTEFSQLSENYLKYSGIQSVSSSEIDEVEKEQPKGSPPLVDTDINEDPVIQQQTHQDVEEEEEAMIVEKEDEAIYLPALMGCRSVECYEWLNRIEEGTYGVVFRGKEKKTGSFRYDLERDCGIFF